MKSGLSASKYIRNNKRTCFVLIIALALTFMAMYVVNYLLMVTGESFKPIYLEMPKKVTYLAVTAETLGVNAEDYPDGGYGKATAESRNELMNRLKQTDGIRDAYYNQVLNARYSAVFGSTGFSFPLVEPEKIPEFLEHFNAELIEGEMPKGDGEILCDSVIMKNASFSVGDWFFENIYGKTFKVVGVISSPEMVCIGTPNGYNNTGWYITILTDEAHSDFSKIADQLGLKLNALDSVDDAVHNRESFKEDVEDVMDSVNSVILLVVIIFLAISVLVAYVSFMRNRVNEYCLYASIGYSKKEIYGMIMREMGIMFGVGVFLGALSAIVTMAVLDATLIRPAGLLSAWWYPQHIISILAAYAAVVGVLQIPILVTVFRIRTIDLMED